MNLAVSHPSTADFALHVDLDVVRQVFNLCPGTPHAQLERPSPLRPIPCIPGWTGVLSSHGSMDLRRPSGPGSEHGR